MLQNIESCNSSDTTSSAFPNRYVLGLRLILFTQFYVSSSERLQQWGAVQPWQSHLNRLTAKVSLAIFSFKSVVVLVQCLLEGRCTSSLERGSTSSRLAPGLRSGQCMLLGRAFASAVESCRVSERRAQWWPFEGVIPEKREWAYS